MQTPSSLGSPLVILNPTANRGDMKVHRTLVRQRVQREQVEYVETSKQGEVSEHAARAAQQGRPVIVVGGDGSIHEAVNGILGTGKQVPLGIVPAGSGNDYAWRTLQLPKDPQAALERAFAGEILHADVGVVNGRYFANSFSVGLDADIALAASKLKKYPLMSGERLYYGATLKQLLFGYHRCPYLRIHLDDRENKLEQRYVIAALTIGPAYGAGFYINPQADFRDGLLEVCTIDYLPLLRALRLLPVVQRGEHAGIPEVTFYRALTARIESSTLVNAELDGEIISAKSFDVKILPGSLAVRV